MGLKEKLEEFQEKRREKKEESEAMRAIRRESEKKAREARITAYAEQAPKEAERVAVKQTQQDIKKEYSPKPHITPMERIGAGSRFIESGLGRLGNISKNLNAPRTVSKTSVKSAQMQKMRNQQKIKIKGRTYYLVGSPQQPYQPPQQEPGMTSTGFQRDRFTELMQVKPMNFNMEGGRNYNDLFPRFGEKKKKGNSLFGF